MAPIVPVEIAHWPQAILDDVAFMTSLMDGELDIYEICAALRAEYPYHRYINPSDVTTIQEWLEARGQGYGGLKEEVKHLVATLGENKALRWRDLVEQSLRVAKEKGWDGYDMFEDEDPRPKGEVEALAEQLGGLTVDIKDREAIEPKEEPKKSVELVSKAEPEGIQRGRKILSRSDWHRKEVEDILRGTASASKAAFEGKPSEQKAARK